MVRIPLKPPLEKGKANVLPVLKEGLWGFLTPDSKA